LINSPKENNENINTNSNRIKGNKGRKRREEKIMFQTLICVPLNPHTSLKIYLPLIGGKRKKKREKNRKK